MPYMSTSSPARRVTSVNVPSRLLCWNRMPAAAVTSVSRNAKPFAAAERMAGAPRRKSLRVTSEGHQTLFHCVQHQLRGAVNIERLHQIGAVHRNRVDAEIEQRSDLLVRPALPDQLQDL